MSLMDEKNKVIYDGNGSSKNFTFNFKIFNEDDIRVVRLDTVTNTKTVLTEAASDFTLTLNVENIGGNIELSSAPLSTEKLMILREGDVEQTLEVERFAFNPEQIGNQLDYTVSLIQDTNEKVGRAVSADETSENFNPSLPSDLEAGSSFFVNPTNDGFEKGPLKDELALSANVTSEISAAIGGLTKADVGLDQVDNTSDINKPLSSIMQANLNNKPNLNQISAAGFSGEYTDILNTPTVAQNLLELINTSDGTNGQVLATNGAGLFSFVNQTGGSGGGGSLTAGSVNTVHIADDAVTPPKMARKVVQKFLSNSVNSFSSTNINDLNVPNLVVGQTYKLTVHFAFYIDGNIGTSTSFSLGDGSTNFWSFDSEYQDGDFNNSSNVASAYTRTYTFVAGGTSLTATVGNASANAYIKGGSNDFSGTYIEIEEADDRQIVANF